MAFNVRVFGHRGIEQLILNKPRQFSSDSVFQLAQPYEFSEVLLASSVAVSSSPVSNPNVTLLRVEVPDGQTIRYEINPPGRSVVAGTQSASLSGKDQFYFRNGWQISIIDSAGLP